MKRVVVYVLNPLYLSKAVSDLMLHKLLVIIMDNRRQPRRPSKATNDHQRLPKCSLTLPKCYKRPSQTMIRDYQRPARTPEDYLNYHRPQKKNTKNFQSQQRPLTTIKDNRRRRPTTTIGNQKPPKITKTFWLEFADLFGCHC